MSARVEGSRVPAFRPPRGRFGKIRTTCLLVVAAACSREPAREAVIVSDSAGVTIVDNDHRRPVWTRETAWRLSPRPAIQIGNQPYDPSQRLYRAEHVRRLSDGRVAVANRGMGDVRIFDTGGYHEITIPFQRDPTLDVGRPRRVYPMPGDTLAIYLVGGEISLWGPDYGFLRRAHVAPPETIFEADLEPVGGFADGSMLLVGRLPVDPGLTGLQRSTLRPMRFGVDGLMLDSFGDLPDDTEVIGDEVYVFGPAGVIAAGDSTIWYSSTETFELREIARGGRTVRVVRHDQPPPPVMQADRAAFRVSAVRQLREDIGDEAAEATVDAYQYAETFPTFSQIVVDELGNVWALGYRWFDMGADYRWTVFSSEGRYLGEVAMPYPLQVHEIGADYVLGHMTDGRGNEAAYIYRLEKPEAGAGS